MVTGTLLATALSGRVPQRTLALTFAVIVYAGATQILLGRKPTGARALPGTPALVAIGLLIGVRHAGGGRGHARLHVRRAAGTGSAARLRSVRLRPALLGIAAGSMLTAPWGGRAAHRMPGATLRRIFAGLLYALATKMV